MILFVDEVLNDIQESEISCHCELNACCLNSQQNGAFGAGIEPISQLRDWQKGHLTVRKQQTYLLQVCRL